MKETKESKEEIINYGTYRLMLTAWMINEISIVFAPVQLSFNGFHLHVVLYILSIIFVGIPLVYSEICMVQYTTNNALDIWKFFPLFRGAGYASIYMVILKIIYLNVVSSWYLLYAFYSVYGSPPWVSCKEFKNLPCIVKYVNVSDYQNCLNLGSSCIHTKTASDLFFDREIGDYTTKSGNCLYAWRTVLCTIITSLVLYLVCVLRYRLYGVIAKSFVIAFTIIVFVLLCISLLNEGAWFSAGLVIEWDKLNYKSCLDILTSGLLTCGTGVGVIGYLTRGVPFRSPATISAISPTLFASMTSSLLGLVLFNGIKSMFFYHGEKRNILEKGNNTFFDAFAEVSEILGYFSNKSFWSLLWYGTIYLCLVTSVWILYMFLYDHIVVTQIDDKRANLWYSAILICVISALSWPFVCSDLTEVLADVTAIIQIGNSFLYSFALYWVYGYRHHANDITFMIGIKASHFWRLSWLFNPIILLGFIYFNITNQCFNKFQNSFFMENISATVDETLFWFLLFLYVLLLLIGAIVEFQYYYSRGKLSKILEPAENWGPKDKVLFRSRKMFVPEIMTREFLYRQVRIHGYRKKAVSARRSYKKTDSEDSLSYKTKWNALTSN
ncbi:sodium-dependent noradrenaline transporter-like [Aricia agestis]|uniref:sodium-dependent noradrenaline transporter-like n=1 Tax=Aricia agestis TaxID=91739 RepID=UPI001C204849|nr:sodium-dependent noradrenaline transporter-like [Aricia agestis]